MKRIIAVLLVFVFTLPAAACGQKDTEDKGGTIVSKNGALPSEESTASAKASLVHTQLLTDKLTSSKAFKEAEAHAKSVIMYNGEIVTGKSVPEVFIEEVENNGSSELYFYRFNETEFGDGVSCTVFVTEPEGQSLYYRNTVNPEGKSDEWELDLSDGEERYKINSISLSKYGVLTVEIEGSSEPSYTQVISNYELFEDYEEKLELAEKYVRPIYFLIATNRTFQSAAEIYDWMPVFEGIFSATSQDGTGDFWTEYPGGRITLDELMPLLNRYFDVDKATVKAKISMFMTDDNTVEYMGDFGGAYPSIIVFDYEEQGDTAKITCRHKSGISGEVDEDTSYIITLKNMADGSFRYLSLATE